MTEVLPSVRTCERMVVSAFWSYPPFHEDMLEEDMLLEERLETEDDERLDVELLIEEPVPEDTELEEELRTIPCSASRSFASSPSLNAMNPVTKRAISPRLIRSPGRSPLTAKSLASAARR